MDNKSFYKHKFNSMLLSSTMGMTVNFIMLICDAVIAGYFFGADGVSSVNLVIPVMSFVLFVSEIFGNGIGILYSRYIGKFDKTGADRLYGMGIIINIAAAIISMIFIFFGKDLYFGLQGVDGKVYELAKDYYTFMPLNAVAAIMYQYVAFMVYTDGDEKCTNLACIVQIGSQIAFSFILCSKMGITGIMLGKVIGNILSTLVASGHFLSNKNTLHFIPYFNIKELLKVIKFSMVDACMYLCWSVMNYLLIVYISRHYDRGALVILAVVMTLVEFGIILDGIGLAMQPLIGTYIGEKNYAMIKRFMKYVLKVTLIAGFAASIIIFAFAPQLVAFFGIESSYLADTVTAARIFAISLVFCSVILVEASYYMLIDQIKTSVMITILREGVAYTLCPIVFSMIFGEIGLWIGLFAATPISLGISLIFVIFKYGKAKFPLLIPNADDTFVVFESSLTRDNISIFSKNVEKTLKDRGAIEKSVLWGAVFTEEILLAVLNKNSNKKGKLLVEVSLIFDKDSVLLIERDSGVIFDPTVTDSDIGNLSDFVLASLMEAHEEKAYQTTTGYNRNIIRLPLDAKQALKP
ncbi:MAG: hypothetical protein IJS61_09700 [Firmicutes bacterium]|nr:hypothetical protein [Bacillota bacterium]